MSETDTELGEWVYCKSHVAPHTTGWCGVGNNRKIGLKATTFTAAYEEVKAMGLPIHNHCRVCYKFIGNDGRMKNVCEEHE